MIDWNDISRQVGWTATPYQLAEWNRFIVFDVKMKPNITKGLVKSMKKVLHGPEEYGREIAKINNVAYWYVVRPITSDGIIENYLISGNSLEEAIADYNIPEIILDLNNCSVILQGSR